MYSLKSFKNDFLSPLQLILKPGTFSVQLLNLVWHEMLIKRLNIV